MPLDSFQKDLRRDDTEVKGENCKISIFLRSPVVVDEFRNDSRPVNNIYGSSLSDVRLKFPFVLNINEMMHWLF